MASTIALIVTAIGVIGVVFGLRQNYRERLRQFEEMYGERYWKLIDQLSLEALKALGPGIWGGDEGHWQAGRGSTGRGFDEDPRRPFKPDL